MRRSVAGFRLEFVIALASSSCPRDAGDRNARRGRSVCGVTGSPIARRLDLDRDHRPQIVDATDHEQSRVAAAPAKRRDRYRHHQILFLPRIERDLRRRELHQLRREAFAVRAEQGRRRRNESDRAALVVAYRHRDGGAISWRNRGGWFQQQNRLADARTRFVPCRFTRRGGRRSG